MPFLRPTNLSASRPTIRELSSYLLSSSQSSQTRSCASLALRQHRTSTCARIPSRDLSLPRKFSSVPSSLQASAQKPKSHDRGPKSSEDTQTDFGSLDVLGNTPAPSTSIDACLWDGFHFNSGVKVVGGSGVVLIAGEAFTWKPWEANEGEKRLRMVNEKGQFEVPDEAWGLLELVWPKPGMLCDLASPTFCCTRMPHAN
jgi:NADH dehydrogenase [ubiquinone] 1 alpha subcomplex assembly factor 3